MELNREIVMAELQSLIQVAKVTDNDFITSPFRRDVLEYAVAIINKLTEECQDYRDIAEYQQSSNMNRAFEIKRLTEENARLQTDYNELYETTTEEIKRLTEENEDLNAQCRYYAEAYHCVKADTVRKMQEMIKERCISGGIYPAFVARTIDQIAKEMLEESKEV